MLAISDPRFARFFVMFIVILSYSMGQSSRQCSGAACSMLNVGRERSSPREARRTFNFQLPTSNLEQGCLPGLMVVVQLCLALRSGLATQGRHLLLLSVTRHTQASHKPAGGASQVAAILGRYPGRGGQGWPPRNKQHAPSIEGRIFTFYFENSALTISRVLPTTGPDSI